MVSLEKRHFQRFKVNFECTLSLEKALVHTRVLDISEGGMSLELISNPRQSISIGELSDALIFSERNELEVQATLIRKSGQNLAFKFDDFDDEFKSEILALIKNLHNG